MNYSHKKLQKIHMIVLNSCNRRHTTEVHSPVMPRGMCYYFCHFKKNTRNTIKILVIRLFFKKILVARLFLTVAATSRRYMIGCEREILACLLDEVIIRRIRL